MPRNVNSGSCPTGRAPSLPSSQLSYWAEPIKQRGFVDKIVNDLLLVRTFVGSKTTLTRQQDLSQTEKQ